MNGGPAPEVLITEAAHRAWWAEVLTVAPAAAAVTVADDDARIDNERVEVAWATPDLFGSGTARRFFGAALRAPNLRWLHTTNAGTDDPVFDRLRANGVKVTTSHHHATNIADYVLHAVLDHTLGAPRWRAAQAAREWRPHGPGEVAGTTWLVVGYGAIGREVARRGRLLGARVVGVRRRPGTASEPVAEMVAPAELASRLAEADVTVLCLPRTPETEGLFGDALFARMRRGSLFVNVGRGALVDEPALLAALDRGAPGAAHLDVTAEEPLPAGHPLWTHPGVTITPHDSGSGSGGEREARAVGIFLEHLRSYVDSGDPEPPGAR